MWPFSRFPGNFKGLCKQIDHFPEDADYEADTAEYFLRECMQFFISFLVLGPALQLSEHQEQGLSRDPCLSRGQEKAKSPSMTPLQRPNLHTCSSLCLQHLSLLSLSGKLLLILQVSAETSPPPGSPPCPQTDSQSTAPLLCCGVLVHLSNHLHHSPTNAARPGTLPSLFTIIISPVTCT